MYVRVGDVYVNCLCLHSWSSWRGCAWDMYTINGTYTHCACVYVCACVRACVCGWVVCESSY